MSLLLLLNPPFNTTVTGVSATGGVGTLAVAQINVSLYSDSAGTPGSFIAVLGQIPDISSGTTTVSFTTQAILAPNTRYWIQLSGITSTTIQWIEAGDNIGTGVATELWYKNVAGSITSGLNSAGPSYQMTVTAQEQTGLSAIGQAGTITTRVDDSGSGVAATGQVGSISASVVEIPTGVAATGQIGVVSAPVFKLLPGVTATGQIGNVSAPVFEILSGVTGTGQIGSEVAQPAGMISGVAGSGFVQAAPLIDIDFTTATLDPRLTFVRAAIATDSFYTDANGSGFNTFAIGVPRINVNGTTGLLLEIGRANSLLQSGTPATQTTASLATGTYTLWVIGTGSATSSAGTATATGLGVAIGGTPNVFVVTVAGTITVTVSGTLNRFQLENSAFPSSYIPTTTVAVTRPVESFTFAGSSWLSSAQGTLLAVATYRINSAGNSLIEVDDGTFSNRIMLNGTGGPTPSVTVVVANVTTVNQALGAAVGLGTIFRSASRYSSVDVRGAANGVLAAANTGVSIPPTLSRLSSAAAGQVFLQHFSYWPYVFTDANLQAITISAPWLPTQVSAADIGVAGSGQSGSLTTKTDESAVSGNVFGTGQAGLLSGLVIELLPGVAGIGQIGSVGRQAIEVLSGVVGTGQTGTITTRTDDTVSLAGASASGQVGTEIGQVGASIYGFMRATGATYNDASGVVQYAAPNVLRTQGGVPLIEAAATNLVINRHFGSSDNGHWSGVNGGVAVQDIALAPDGTTTATNITESTASGNKQHFILYNFGVLTIGDVYTVSAYVQAAGNTQCIFRLNTAAITFDLTLGTVVSNTTNRPYVIVPLANGWFRLAATFVVGASNDTFGIWYTGTLSFYIGTDGVGLNLWGPQVETGPTLTSYIAPNRNLCSASQAVGNALWLAPNLTIALNDTTAPDGSLTAAHIMETATTTVHNVAYNAGQQVIGDVYTFSVYAKAAERTQVCILPDSGLSVGFDLSTGLVIGSPAVPYSITPVGNGWYRCSATYSRLNTTSNYYILPHNVFASYAGTAGFGIWVWGAQIERGSLTDYIPENLSRATDAGSYSLGQVGVPVSQVAMSLTGVRGNGVAAGSTVYHANAVHLDGTFWANLTGGLQAADSPFYSFSGWIKQPTATTGVFSFIYDISPPDAESGPFVTTAGEVGFEAYNPITGNGLYVETAPGTFVFNSAWKHVFGWLDNTTQTAKIYLNGVDVTFIGSPTGGPQSFRFNGLAFDLSDDTVSSGQPLAIMDLADFWIAPGILEKDPTKFRDPITGKPKDPATFASAAFILTGDKDHFLLNTLGTENALTLQASTLTNALNSPSDGFGPSVISRPLGVTGTGQIGTIAKQISAVVAGVTGTGQAGTATTRTDDTIALSGLTGTGQAGTATTRTDDTNALVGVVGTAQIGTVSISVGVTLTGVAGTGQLGTTAKQISAVVAGVSGTGQIGSEVTSVGITLTGVAGTGQIGTVSISVLVTLTGVAGTGQAGPDSSILLEDSSGVILLEDGSGNLILVYGTLVANIAPQFAGVVGTGQIGSEVEQITISLLGAAGSGQIGTFAKTDANTVIGVAGSGQIGTDIAQVGAQIFGFMRASTATYFDVTGTMQLAAINALRTTYDLTAHTPSYLLEAAATNILLNSNTGTLGSNSVSSADITRLYAPATLWKATNPSTVSWNIAALTNIPVTPSTNYVFSAWIYVPSAWAGGTIVLNVDGSGGAVTNHVSDLSLRNQWQRISTSFTTGAAITIFNAVMRQNAAFVAGDVVYHTTWQVEQVATFTSSPTSYIPTTGTAATRAADGGAIAFGQIGVSSVEIDATTSGVSTIGQAGTLTTRDDDTGTLLGVSGAGQAGIGISQIAVPVSGLAGIGQAGSVSELVSSSIVGAAGTGQAGTATEQISKTLTTIFGTGQAGTIIVTELDSILGVFGTGQAGTETEQITVALNGTSGISQIGSVTVSVTDTGTIAGVAGTGQVGAEIAQISLAIIGVSGVGQVGIEVGRIAPQFIGTFGTGQIGGAIAQTSILIIGTSGISQAGSLLITTASQLIGVTAAGQIGSATVQDTVTIVGAAGIGQIGLELGQITVSLTGITSSGQTGSLSDLAPIAIAAIAGSGQIGGEIAQIIVAILGVSGTGQAGIAITKTDATVSLSGVTGTGQVGLENTQVAVSPVGVAGSGQIGIEAISITVALTGALGTCFAASVLAQVPGGVALFGLISFGQAGTLRIQDSSLITLIGVTASGQTGTARASDGGIVSGVSSNGQSGAPGIEIDVPVIGVAGIGQAGPDSSILLEDSSGVILLEDGSGSLILRFGTLVPTIAPFFIGVGGIGQIGAEVEQLAVSPLGASAAGQVGSIIASDPRTIIGNSGTGQIGSVVAQVAVSVAGGTGTGQIGAFVVSETGTIGSVFGTGQIGTTIPQVAVPILGLASTGQIGSQIAQVVAAIIGATGTGQIGTSLAPSDAGTIVGATGLAQTGTEIAQIAIVINGVTSVGQIGQLTTQVSDTGVISGVAANGQAGSDIVQISILITGLSAAGQVGSIIPSLASQIVGVAGNGQIGIAIAQTAVSLTGLSSIGRCGTITAQEFGAIVSTSGFGQAGAEIAQITVPIVGTVCAANLGTLFTEADDTAAIIGTSGIGQAGIETSQITIPINGVVGIGQANGQIAQINITIIATSAACLAGSLIPSDAGTFIGTFSNGQIGTETAQITVSINGVAGNGQAGTIVTSTAATVNLVGVTGVGQSGIETTQITVTALSVTGVGQAGTEIISLDITLTGVQTVSTAASVLSQIPGFLALFGLIAFGQVGNVSIQDSSVIALTGVTAAGQVGVEITQLPQPIAGVSGNGSIADVTSQILITLPSVVGSADAGTVIDQPTGTIAGTTTNGLAASLAATLSVPVADVNAIGIAGTVSDLPSGSIFGNATTGTAGSLTSQITMPVNGVFGTGSIASFVVPVSGTITSNVAVGSIAGLVPQITILLASTVGSGTVGDLVTPATNVTTGVASFGTAASLAIAVDIPLNGVATVGSVGLLSLIGQYQQGLIGGVATASASALVDEIDILLQGVNATSASADLSDLVDAILLGTQGLGVANAVETLVFGSIVDVLLDGVGGVGIAGHVKATGRRPHRLRSGGGSPWPGGTAKVSDTESLADKMARWRQAVEDLLEIKPQDDEEEVKPLETELDLSFLALLDALAAHDSEPMETVIAKSRLQIITEAEDEMLLGLSDDDDAQLGIVLL